MPTSFDFVSERVGNYQYSPNGFRILLDQLRSSARQYEPRVGRTPPQSLLFHIVYNMINGDGK
jgi:hypothetical protein